MGGYLQSVGRQAELGEVRVAVMELTPDEVNNLFVIPKVIIPAPGMGLVIMPISIFIQIIAGTIPSTVLETILNYEGIASGTLEATAINIDLTQSAPNNTIAFSSGMSTEELPTSPTVPQSDLENKAIIFGFSSSGEVGPVDSISVGSDAGTGYAPGDTGYINQGGDIGANYEVDTVGLLGQVLTFHLTAGGFGYVTATDVLTGVLSGGGDGTLLVDINSIGIADQSLRVTVHYMVIPLS